MSDRDICLRDKPLLLILRLMAFSLILRSTAFHSFFVLGHGQFLTSPLIRSIRTRLSFNQVNTYASKDGSYG